MSELTELLRTAAATHTQHFGILREAAARIEALEAALEHIVQWSEAYPLDIFPEPDWNQVKRMLGDRILSAVSASNMRHVVEGIGKIARAALDKDEAT